MLALRGVMALALVTGCSSATTATGDAAVDAVDAVSRESAVDAPDAVDAVDAVSRESAVDAPDAVDAVDTAVVEGATCGSAAALVVGQPWTVPAGSGGQWTCEGRGPWAETGWGRIVVPARGVLVLRVWGNGTDASPVEVFDGCAAATCLATVGGLRDDGVERRFFNDADAPRTLTVAARAGVVVRPSFAPAPNLRCADARRVDAGTIVDDDPFPAVAPEPACPQQYERAGATRWYRVTVPGGGGSSLVATAPPNFVLQLHRRCDAATCAVGSYRRMLDNRSVLRWTNPGAADETVFLAASATFGAMPSPVTFSFELTSPEEGHTCALAISAPTTYDRPNFSTRWGSERRPVCGDPARRSTPVRWFRLVLPPGQTVLASAYELASGTQPFWQLYDGCDTDVCRAVSPRNTFANELQYTNATDAPQDLRLALGNLTASFVDQLEVRVRVVRASEFTRCENARPVAPNTLLAGEDLSTGAVAPPRCGFGTRQRRALWYVTRVAPGHRFTAQIVNSRPTGATLDFMRGCAAAGCGYDPVNRTDAPVDVFYVVSQDIVPGLYSTYDLVTLSTPAAP